MSDSAKTLSGPDLTKGVAISNILEATPDCTITHRRGRTKLVVAVVRRGLAGRRAELAVEQTGLDRG